MWRPKRALKSVFRWDPYQHTLELPHTLQGEMPSIEDMADAIDQLKVDQDGDPTTMG
jgi:hypothetical protein